MSITLKIAPSNDPWWSGITPSLTGDVSPDVSAAICDALATDLKTVEACRDFYAAFGAQRVWSGEMWWIEVRQSDVAIKLVSDDDFTRVVPKELFFLALQRWTEFLRTPVAERAETTYELL